MNADNIIQNAFTDKDIFFITPDVKRGIGLDEVLTRYHIICLYKEPLVTILRNQGAHVFCLSEHISSSIGHFNNTGKLLEHPLVEDYVKKHTERVPWIMYFKPSQKIDMLIKQKGYHAIGNSSEIGNAFEDKIRFQSILSDMISQNSIPSMTGKLRELKFKDLAHQYGIPFVIQFGFGWAGKSTFFIKTESEFEKLVSQYQYSNAKVSKKITGFTVLNNCCAHNDTILVSPPAIQLSNITELFDKPAVTCGRQWPVRFLTNTQIDTISDLSQKVGKLLIVSGYKGFFGIDYIIDSVTGKVYLSEVNPRLTASSAFYTRLELRQGNIPLLAYHIASFSHTSLPADRRQNNSIIGSQIILRSPSKTHIINSVINFSKIKITDGKIKKQRPDYYPEKLHPDEYIFMKNTHTLKDAPDDENARIETLTDVLKDTSHLKEVFLGLLRSKIMT